jgi:hypothetical protein
MRTYIRMLFHLIGISLLVGGVVLIHARLNMDWFETHIYFYGIPIHRSVVGDWGFWLIVLSFLTEFILTFKPIRILIDSN